MRHDIQDKSVQGVQLKISFNEATGLKLSNDLLTFLSHAAHGKGIKLMFVLGDYSREEQKGYVARKTN